MKAASMWISAVVFLGLAEDGSTPELFQEHLRPTLSRAISSKAISFVQWIELRPHNPPGIAQIMKREREEFRRNNGFPAGQLDKMRKHMSPEDYQLFHQGAARRIEENRREMADRIVKEITAILPRDDLQKLKDEYIRETVAFYGCLVLEAQWVQEHLGARIDNDELRRQHGKQVEELTTQLVENINSAQTTAGQKNYAGKSLIEHIERTLSGATDRD